MFRTIAWLTLWQLAWTTGSAIGQTVSPATESGPAETASQEAPGKAPEENGNLVRLTKDYDVWIDPKRKLVVVDGSVCLREGQLEMFACPRGTKEHESIVSVNCKAQYVHAGLLAVGAKPGRPVQFAPEYSPATGTKIEVLVLWIDKEGKRHKVRAQEWIKNLKTGKPMSYDWVFAGSGFRTDEQTGERSYYGDAGDFICVSNFTTAMLDVPVASSQDTEDLMFTALTENIPPLDTKVRLVLIPQLSKEPSTKTPASPAKSTSEGEPAGAAAGGN
ncbi:MAG: YdjY domain-containing protein [Planctomycetes bacterium]|nr:YdjY domain-containing protein [Planctomycetota bacterium]